MRASFVSMSLPKNYLEKLRICQKNLQLVFLTMNKNHIFLLRYIKS